MISNLEEPDRVLLNLINEVFLFIAILDVSYKFLSTHMIRRLNLMKFIYTKFQLFDYKLWGKDQEVESTMLADVAF